MNFCIIIPAYNESKVIEKFNLKICEYLEDKYQNQYSIVYVNDGSIDDTQAIIKNIEEKYKNITLINLIKNSGKMDALTIASKEIANSNKNYDFFIFMDADFQHPIYFLEKFIEKYKSNNLSIIGRRVITKLPLYRKIYSYIFRITLMLFSMKSFKSNLTDFMLIKNNDLVNLIKNEILINGIIITNYIKVSFINFPTLEREASESKFNFYSLVRLAFEILNHHKNYYISSIYIILLFFSFYFNFYLLTPIILYYLLILLILIFLKK